MAIVGIPLFIATFIVAPIIAANTYEGEDLGIILVLAFIWLIHLGCGQHNNESASYLNNIQDFLESMSNINMGIKSPPFINFHMECYHYETRKQGKSEKRVKVVTHRANQKFKAQKWIDESASIASLFYLQAMYMTRLLIDETVEVGPNAITRYDSEK